MWSSCDCITTFCTHAKTANKVALESEKERDTDETVLEELKRQLQPKRGHTDDDVGNVHEMIANVDNGDLRDHRQQATSVQNRHNVQVGSHQNQVKPRTGTDDSLHYTRLGLAGWISFWCLGDSVLTVDILHQVVVMYLNADLISRPLPPPLVSPYKGIMSCF
jgi:hypothetical protein